MFNKGLMGTIIVGVCVIILLFIMTSSGILRPPQDQQEFVIKDVVLNLRSLDLVSVDEEKAIIQVGFNAFNPNMNSVVLESIRYNLYANGIRVASSEIGERPEGFATGTGRTFTMYREFSLTLNDKVEVKNTEPLIQIWNDLLNNKIQWRVSGTFFVTDPVRAGGQELNFDFTI
ncbi:MAG: hypothetical protein EX285_00310 [Thaumarchaeota archaeon]|nr:hypothetical protein [Nitrososphaerota archaeon]